MAHNAAYNWRGDVMKMKGFTLVELMVVVGVIGIIGAIAYPSYQGYIRDTYQSQAAADLRVCALALDRYYSNGFTYVGGGAQCTLWSPSDGVFANRQYDLTLPTLTQNDYTIRATPVGGTCDPACIELEADGTQTIIE